MLKLTTAAADQVLKAAQQGGTEGLSLRLAAFQMPDGAIDYRIGFDEPTEDDIRMTCGGVDIAMTPEQAPLLDETTMDYVEMEPGQFRFIFMNPKDPHYKPPTEA